MKKLLILIIIFITGYFALDKFYPQLLQKLPFVETEKEETKLADETANWKTYSNEEYGFEVKYPNDHKVITQIGAGVVLMLVSENLKPLEGSIDKADMVLSFDKETDPGVNLEKFHFVENRNEVIIDGLKATQRLVYYSAGYGTRYSTVFKKEGRGYYEVVSYEVGLFPTAKSVYDQILSTFKFTK